MSEYTLEQLNALGHDVAVLVGFADKRRNPWWFNESYQNDDESNVYPGAIPLEDVRRRLFYWEAIEAQSFAVYRDESGLVTVPDPTRRQIVRPAELAGDGSIAFPATVLGVHSDGYKIHQYTNWLLDSVSLILDDELQISSAGVLRSGKLAWVSVEVPENIVTPEGVEFRPFLMATTSHDASVMTTYNRCITNVVCDNTHAAGLAEGKRNGTRFAVRHTRNSEVKLGDAREALQLVYQMADDFKAEVAELTATTVTDGQFQAFLDSLVPVPDDDGRKRDNAQEKHATYEKLYTEDERCAPWKGTAWGVVQTVNTFEHHMRGVRGDRGERNMLRTINGEFESLDVSTVNRLNAVLATEATV